MSGITSHILDTSLGRPAAGIKVTLSRKEPGKHWATVGSGTTNDDGRVSDLTAGTLQTGKYRLHFDVAAYFAEAGRDAFYEEVEIHFRVGQDDQHYHVPLLLNPFGYSTYRGS